MMNEIEYQFPLFASLPALDEDELDDAEFRAKDRAWAALVQVYENRKDADKATYQMIGDRIGRSRTQVQRWMSSSVNMTLKSIGLLAEGLDADLVIDVRQRTTPLLCTNYVHPSEAAKKYLAPRALKKVSTSNAGSYIMMVDCSVTVMPAAASGGVVIYPAEISERVDA